MNTKEIKRQMIDEYGKICFMGGELSKKNELTLHHIQPVRMSGKTTHDNLALLGRLQHDLFNLVELYYPKKASDINDLFIEYKRVRDRAIIEYLKLYSQIVLDTLEYQVEDTGKMYVLKKR